MANRSKDTIKYRGVWLSPRLCQCIYLIAKGLPYKIIAYRMGIGEGALKVYLSKIYSLMNAAGLQGTSQPYLIAMYHLSTNHEKELIKKAAEKAEGIVEVVDEPPHGQ